MERMIGQRGQIRIRTNFRNRTRSTIERKRTSCPADPLSSTSFDSHMSRRTPIPTQTCTVVLWNRTCGEISIPKLNRQVRVNRMHKKSLTPSSGGARSPCAKRRIVLLQPLGCRATYRDTCGAGAPQEMGPGYMPCTGGRGQCTKENEVECCWE